MPVWLSWAWLEEGLGCGPSCCLAGIESSPQPEGTQGPRSQSGLEGGKRPTYRARTVEGGWERLNAALFWDRGVCRSPLFLRAQPCLQSPLREGGL